ncbi:hypothetical protein OIO90_004302 [Microbotryomycetes sp. JL221]|nr:hypothetical protein OIO90_004302 [Microbotryomycetes sp. JL221]
MSSNHGIDPNSTSVLAAWNVLKNGSDEERRAEFKTVFDEVVRDSESTAYEVFRHLFPRGPGHLGPVDRGDFKSIRQDFRFEEEWKEDGVHKLKIHIEVIGVVQQFASKLYAFAVRNFLGNHRPVWPWERVALAVYEFKKHELGLASQGQYPSIDMPGDHEPSIKLPDPKNPGAPYGTDMRFQMLLSMCTMKTSSLTGDDLLKASVQGSAVTLNALWIARQAFNFFGVPNVSIDNELAWRSNPNFQGFIETSLPWTNHRLLWDSQFKPMQVWEDQETRVKQRLHEFVNAESDSKWFYPLTTPNVISIGASEKRKTVPFASMFARAYDANDEHLSRTPNPRLTVVLAREFTIIAAFVLHQHRNRFEPILDKFKLEGGQTLTELLFDVVVPKSLFHITHLGLQEFRFAEAWKQSTFGEMNPLKKAHLLIVLQSAIKWLGLAGQVARYLPTHVNWQFDVGDSWRALQVEIKWVDRLHRVDSESALWTRSINTSQAYTESVACSCDSPKVLEQTISAMLCFHANRHTDEHDKRFNKIMNWLLEEDQTGMTLETFRQSYEIRYPGKTNLHEGLTIE